MSVFLAGVGCGLLLALLAAGLALELARTAGERRGAIDLTAAAARGDLAWDWPMPPATPAVADSRRLPSEPQLVRYVGRW